ncbi:hypothetical protein ANTQUA_LOCUS7470 [Anthophora quadrimaculata]
MAHFQRARVVHRKSILREKPPAKKERKKERRKARRQKKDAANAHREIGLAAKREENRIEERIRDLRFRRSIRACRIYTYTGYVCMHVSLTVFNFFFR